MVPCKAGNCLLWAWGQRSEGTGRLVALGAGHCADRAGISRGGGKKSQQIPRGICSPQTHGPGCSSLSYGNAAEMGFSFGLQVLPEPLWGHGAVCVPCVLHVLLSAPGSASGFRFCSQPQMLSLRSEGQVQPPLLTSCSGVSACGCSPGPAPFPGAPVGWGMAQTAPHVIVVPCTVPPAQTPLPSLGAGQG